MTLTRLTNDDWEDLLPGKTVTFGKTAVVIEPLGIAKVTTMFRKMRGLAEAAKGIGLTIDNFEEPEKLAELFTLIMDLSPDLLQEATGIHKDDIGRLPIGKGAELLAAVLDVNITSQENLGKNFKALRDLISKTKTEKAGE